MNSSNYRFTLDMQSNQSQVSLPVRLGDTNRKLYIILTNGGTPFILEDGFRAVLFGRKADGTILNNDCIIESKSTIRYDFTENTASASGVVDCELRVYDAQGKLVTTPRFILVVDERVLYDEDIVSESERLALDAIFGSETAREKAEKDRAEAEDSRIEAETARATAESNRALAETSRTTAENSRVEAEGWREFYESARQGNEVARSKAETARQIAESEREQASATMTAMFNIIIGKNASHDVASLSAVPNYIFNNLAKFNEGDVIFIADNGFDLVCMGRATQEELDTNGYYSPSDIIWGDLTIEAGGTYIFADGSSRKFTATTEKLKLPIGQEELDAHNEDGEAHNDIREQIAQLDNIVDVALNSANDRISNAEQALADGLREVSIADSQYTDWAVQQAKSNMEHYTDEKVAKVETAIAETSNAIKGTATGNVVRVNDVSPIEHTVKCKVKSDDAFIDLTGVKVKRCGKNFIPYPYQEKTKTSNGITYTVNDDGTITANGTASPDGVGFHLGMVDVRNGNAMLSGCPQGGEMQKYRITGDCYKDGTFIGSVFDIGSGASLLPDCDSVRPYLYIYAGVTVNNLVFKPQIEVGSVARKHHFLCQTQSL